MKWQTTEPNQNQFNFGPGDATLAHTADERIDVATLESTHAVLAELLRRGLEG